ncbi:MAG: TIGR03986 family CRISPR-associated RAMP protein, partial [Anaerolineales bacterium]|nr:TIGR03986 family CRISPR-associated RAMP protein [Anaerolineales bacterium]
APYNFIPLPEKMVEAQPPLDHDHYYPEPMAVTGWIECELETCSPIYIRGMLTEAQFADFGQAGPDKLTDEQKTKMAAFFGIEENVPLLPGSSLRGMIRQIMEIVGHGRMRYVSPTPTFTFRAVAAQADDPLRDPYQGVTGRLAANVLAGFLQRRGDEWWIQPAKLPSSIKINGTPLAEQGAFLKIKERNIPAKSVPGLYRLNSPDYKPLYHPVSFDMEDKRGQRGRYTAVTRIGSRQEGYGHQGVLVCSGNMMETGSKTNRKNHALILLQDEKAKEIKIDQQAVEDYRNGLTPFQNDELTAWGGQGWGCLKDGAPVFYVPEGNSVRYFGHSPNFRIPARLNVSGETRAANPRDFVPDYLRRNSNPDLVEAIFGWVEDKNDPGIGLKEQRAGRVFFTDARCVSGQENVWYKDEPIVPHVLASPKATTFQHYLVQDGRAGQNGHHPDDKKALAHYGTSPNETHIRGYKLYWHKGQKPDIEASATEQTHPKQLTKIKPVRDGVKFQFKVHFENLRPEELGLLWWALALPGEEGKQYRHKLGMGKPLGMGGVAITPKLFVTDREARYQTLFGGELWEEAARAIDAQPYVEAMNRYLLQEQGLGARQKNITELERIQALLAMLEWREGTTEWQAKTRYMEIERPTGRLGRDGKPETFNEYKERPVLPDPFWVIGQKVTAMPPKQQPPKQTKPQNQTKPAPTQQSKRTAPEIGERVLGKVHFIESNGDVYLKPEEANYRDWLFRITCERAEAEGTHYQVKQPRPCLVVALLPDDEIVECKPAPPRNKKRKK